MPVISRFYGIVIKMYFSPSEHGVPHVHAIYGERDGVYAIESVEMLEGDLPVRCRRMVEEWMKQHRSDLLDMWNHQEFRQLPGLE